MQNSDAVKMINELKFMPGWSFEAMDTNGETIMARALIDTVNSDHDQATKDYPQKITLERMILVHPKDYGSSDDLAAALMTWIIEIMIHESREFLRLGSEGLRSPFHPHRPEGESAWNSKVTNTKIDPMRGMIVLNV